MKKEDLMIGDWVTVSGTPMRIGSLFHRLAGFFDEKGEILYHGYNMIEPIPTTDEFLEKNGWEKDVQDGRTFNNSKNYQVVQRGMNDNSVYKIGEWDFTYPAHPFFSAIADVSEVHKFQHALKVLDIEQKIIL